MALLTMPRAAGRWVFTCEHGGHGVPAEFASLFAGQGTLLRSHRGWDAGSLEVFRVLAASCADAAHPATTTRLLVDLNRSLHHRRVFSEFTAGLPQATREDIVARYWRPWRAAVRAQIAGWAQQGHAITHISVHSFTPVLDGQVRNTELGLLYDPSRPAERALCLRWRELLRARGWRVRLNYPYRGSADGHTTALRREFPQGYAGIELELNQALVPDRLAAAAADLVATVESLRSSSNELE